MKFSAISLSIVLAGIAGCTTVPGLNPRTALLAELNANRAKWAAAGLQTYQFRYSHSCFCPPETVRPKNINVENGAVASAIYVDDGGSVTLDQFADVPTINELFDQIQEILDAPESYYEGYALIFEYDAALGYPKSIKLVAPVNIADGGSTQTAELLPPTDFREKLNLNRAKWNATGTKTYQFRYSQFCFCPTDTVRPKDIIVENGKIALATYVDTGRPVSYDLPADQQADAYANLPTINDLFDQIQAILDAPPSIYDGYSLTFEYDDVLGYPTTIKLFAPSHIADGDHTQTAKLTPFKDYQTPLTANRTKWEAAGIRSYQFRYSRDCFCPPEIYRDKNIVVENGVVVSATYVDDGSPVPLDFLDDLPTINDLFDQIQDFISRPPSWHAGYFIEYKYDDALGYPKSIVYQAPSYTADGFATQKADFLTPVDLQGTLDANRAKWNAAEMQKYQFRYSHDCSCPPDNLRPKDIIVWDHGQRVWARYVDNGWAVDVWNYDDVPTINDLFDQIQAIIHTRQTTYRGYSLSFEYDEALGYPKSIKLVAPPNIPNGNSTQTVDLQLPSELQASLDTNRAMWDSTGIQTYHFRYRGWYGLRDIVVVNGVVVSATNLDDGSPVPPDELANLRTINDLFDQIQQSLDHNRTFQLTVEYDSTLGYPRSIVYAEYMPDLGSQQTAMLLP